VPRRCRVLRGMPAHGSGVAQGCLGRVSSSPPPCHRWQGQGSQGGRLSAGCAVPGTCSVADDVAGTRRGAMTEGGARGSWPIPWARAGAAQDGRPASLVMPRAVLQPAGFVSALKWTALPLGEQGCRAGPCFSCSINGVAGPIFQYQNLIRARVSPVGSCGKRSLRCLSPQPTRDRQAST
jgi:hypothetical protein